MPCQASIVLTNPIAKPLDVWSGIVTGNMTNFFDSESAAFVNNADQWPDIKTYRRLLGQPNEKHIRLIDLSYDDSTKRVICDLKHIDLDAPNGCEEYHALSYYWGAPGTERPVYVDGVRVTVRKTLYDFFKAICRRYKKLTIWNDVLCINQKDVVERNQQVSIMCNIFENASTVISWLGKGDGDTNFLFQKLESIHSHGITALENMPLSTRSQISSYAAKLLSHPYFTRVWIVQECVVARVLYLVCGESIMEWHSFAEAIRRVVVAPIEKSRVTSDRVPGPTPDLPFVKELTTLRTRRINHEQIYILDWIRTFNKAACVDRRDKIYGFRGLAERGDEISVDYGKDIVHAILQALLITSDILDAPVHYSMRSALELFTLIPLDHEETLSGIKRSELALRFYGGSVDDGKTQEIVSAVSGFRLDTEVKYYSFCCELRNWRQKPPTKGDKLHYPDHILYLGGGLRQPLKLQHGDVLIDMVRRDEVVNFRVNIKRRELQQPRHNSGHSWSVVLRRSSSQEWMVCGLITALEITASISWIQLCETCLLGGIQVCKQSSSTTVWLRMSTAFLFAAISTKYGLQEERDSHLSLQEPIPEEATAPQQLISKIYEWAKANESYGRNQQLCQCSQA